MSRESLLSGEAARLAVSIALHGEYLDEILLKLAFVNRIYTSNPAGTEVVIDELIDILEDEELGLSDGAAVAALTAAGFLVADDTGERWRTADVVRPADPLATDESEVDILATHEEVVALFAGATRSEAPVSLDGLIRCVDRTSRWGLTIAAALPERLDGVPCFWEYDDEGYRPFNPVPASVTTSDALRLCFERVRFGAAISAGVAEAGVIHQLWRKLLAMRRVDTPWHRGAFSVEGEDDDFVGAFDPARSQMGPCPTVDATGGAVVALCGALSAQATAGANAPQDLVDESRHAVREGIGFLLRCQLAGGGWPLYRYEGDTYSMVERDVSSWYAMEAISAAVLVSALDSETQERARSATIAFVELAERTAQVVDNRAWWAPDFVTPHPRPQQRLLSTATVALSLGAAGRAWPGLAERVAPLRRAAARTAAAEWSPDPAALAVINFRVPTWDGPAETRFPWEWPLDTLMVQMLAEIDEPWDDALSDALAFAVSGFLATEVNGHWNDALMKRESGEDRAVVGTTLFVHSAMLAYARRQAQIGSAFACGQHETGVRVP